MLTEYLLKRVCVTRPRWVNIVSPGRICLRDQNLRAWAIGRHSAEYSEMFSLTINYFKLRFIWNTADQISPHRRLLMRCHDDVIKWKHFARYWPFVRGIHWLSVNSPYKGQWRGALMFSLICAWINRWVINHEASDLRHHQAHYDVIVKAPR